MLILVVGFAFVVGSTKQINRVRKVMAKIKKITVRKRVPLNPFIANLLGKVIPPGNHSMLQIHLHEHSALKEFERGEAGKYHYDEIAITHRLAKKLIEKGYGEEALPTVNQAAIHLNAIYARWEETEKFTMTQEEIIFFSGFLFLLKDLRQLIMLNDYKEVVKEVNSEILSEQNEAAEKKAKAESNEAT